jgi:hypothetical protein
MAQGQKLSRRRGHQTMTMTNNETTTINASFWTNTQYSMILGFPSCKKWLSFSVAAKLLLWLVVVTVIHKGCKFLDERSTIVDVQFNRNSRLFQWQQKVLVWLAVVAIIH